MSDQVVVEKKKKVCKELCFRLADGMVTINDHSAISIELDGAVLKLASVLLPHGFYTLLDVLILETGYRPKTHVLAIVRGDVYWCVELVMTMLTMGKPPSAADLFCKIGREWASKIKDDGKVIEGTIAELKAAFE